MATTPFHSRAEWGARPPRSRSSNVAPDHDTAHWGGPSPWKPGTILAPGAHDRCPSIIRAWQAYHMDHNGWADLAYSSVVCPHGHRYEGRGPGVRTAANGTNTSNYLSLATVGLWGTGDPLTPEAKAAFRDEAERLRVPLNKVHSDWYGTSCPGDEIRNWVRAGAPAPAGTAPAPAPPPVIPPSIDWAALRRFIAANLRNSLAEQPTISSSSPWMRVLLLQKVLNFVTAPNPRLAEDGVWGPATDRAVKEFQRFFGLTVDGIVGDVTRFYLISILDKIRQGLA